jgi:hypothetical protein
MAEFLALAAIFTGSPALAQQAWTRQTAAYVPGEILIKLKGKSNSSRAQAFIGRAVSQKSMALKGSWSGLNLHHFTLPPQKDVPTAVSEMESDPDVEYAEPNYIVTRQGSGPEGPPMSEAQMRASIPRLADEAEQLAQAQASGGAVNAQSAGSGTYSQSNAPIQAPQAWAQMTSGLAPAVIAVIDTGIDFTDTVFINSGAIWTNAGEIPGNGIDDEGNGYIDDIHGWNFVYGNNTPQDDDGHGTHVSGIILGMTQDILAARLSPATVRIMPLKFLDSSGSGTTSDAVQAVYYAANNGARIFNNSWGGGGFSSALLDAINYSYSLHCLFVAAAGNASSDNDVTPTYPASYSVPNIVAVAATSDADALASFSNYGATSVNLGGPGVSILSTLPNNTWGYESGTSMATPMITGMAALMSREKPAMYGYQLRSLIFGATQAIASLSGRTTTQGRGNAYNSVVAAQNAVFSAAQPAYDPSAVERAMASAGSSDTSGGCGTIARKMLDQGGDDGSLGGGAAAAILCLLLAPIAISLALRARSRTGRDQRKHERFNIASSVTLKLGDRELSGSVSSISLGGAQVNADALLENGGLVAMRISSPDGRDEIEVQGRVVWSEDNRRYGVAFAQASEGARAKIERWTAGLVRR